MFDRIRALFVYARGIVLLLTVGLGVPLLALHLLRLEGREDLLRAG